jgi:hypothetical protein
VLNKQAATWSNFGITGTDRILIGALQMKILKIVSQCREQAGWGYNRRRFRSQKGDSG